MFQQLNSPVLGIVENMSYMPLPDGSIHDLFGRGGARRAAKELGLVFLGEIPMYTDLRINSDEGKPHSNFDKNRELGQALETIVGNLAGEVSRRNLQTQAPTLTIS